MCNHSSFKTGTHRVVWEVPYLELDGRLQAQLRTATNKKVIYIYSFDYEEADGEGKKTFYHTNSTTCKHETKIWFKYIYQATARKQDNCKYSS